MSIRVYQIAKEYSRSINEVMKILKNAGIEVASQTAPLDEHALHTVRATLGKYALTVVDGDVKAEVEVVAPVAEPEAPAKKPVRGKKKKKKKEPEPAAAPRLAVRVIKRHEDPKPQETAPPEPVAEVEEKPAANSAQRTPPAPQKRLLKPRMRRSSQIEDRIQKAAAAKETPKNESQHRDNKRGRVTTASGPGTEAPPVEQRKGPQPRRPEKRLERPIMRSSVGKPQPPRPGGNDNTDRSRPRPPGNRPPGNRPPGNRPPGNRPPGNRPAGNSTRGFSAPGPTPPMAQPSAGGKGGNAPARNRFGPPRPPFGGAGARRKKKKRRRRVEQFDKVKMMTTARVELPDEDLGIIMLSEGCTVKELAEKVDRKAKDVIKRLFEKDIMATLNDVLDGELAIDLAKDFGYLAEIVSFEEDIQIQEEEVEISDTEEGEKTSRPPIVTIMGHVDHGKTTLLDTMRKAKVASGEAGGITQHIGAYCVPYNGKQVVFLDTPGHEAFTKMRARGASVTDIVILMVAADDGVKPQTVEAINHAKAAKVPIITCINKIDKPDANPDRVKQMLTEHQLIIEDFGGDSPCVQISAKHGQGIDELLEMILLVAELNDYQGTDARRARGAVIEAKLDRGRGPVATVIVQDGTVNVGDYFITGQTYGKIRAMHDHVGLPVTSAGPSIPVEILGIQEVPHAGDSFQVLKDEFTARKISSFRKEKAREDHLRHQHTSLDQLLSNMNNADIKDLSVIIKADVHGSAEGLVYALGKIESAKVNLRIVHQGVGNITKNDVLLAVTADAIIIGFSTKIEPGARELADAEGIDVQFFSIIYEVVDKISAAMLGLVAPTLEEREIGKASVRQVFAVAKGKIAGCMVDSGSVKRDALVRVFRKGNELHQGKLQTLKRFKDDVNEVKTGFECGIGIHDFSDIEENDELRFFVMEEVQATKL